jgi:hypothetical protein
VQWSIVIGGLVRFAGRPPKLTEDDIETAKAMLAKPDIGVTQIGHRLDVSPAMLYRYISAARTAKTRALQASVEPSRPPRCLRC